MATVTLETIGEEVKSLRRKIDKIMDRIEGTPTICKNWVTASVFAKEFGPTKNSDGKPLNNDQLRYLRRKHPSIYKERSRQYSIDAYKKILNQQ